MLVCFSGRTADEVWQEAADMFRSGRAEVDQSSRGGTTHEILHVSFCIEDPRQRWVSTRVPAMNPAFGLAEVVWIMAGRNDSAFLNFWNPVLPKYAGTGETYDGAYGHRLRHQLGIDQLERAYRTLKANPASRQVVLQIWDTQADLPNEDGSPRSPDIPCNIVSLLKVREGKLHWTQIIRSNDLFLGVPHNFVQFMTLQEIMAGWLGLELGSYVQWSDSLHVYEERLGEIRRTPTTPAPDNNESIAIPKSDFDTTIQEIVPLLSGVANHVTPLTSLTEKVAELCLPSCYQNLLRVIAADALRRCGDSDASTQVVSQVSNPTLRYLWDRWAARQAEEASSRP